MTDESKISVGGSVSGEEREITEALDNWEHHLADDDPSLAGEQTRAKARWCIENLFREQQREIEALRAHWRTALETIGAQMEEIKRDNSLILSYVEEVKSLRAELASLKRQNEEQLTAEEIEEIRFFIGYYRISDESPLAAKACAKLLHSTPPTEK